MVSWPAADSCPGGLGYCCRRMNYEYRILTNPSSRPLLARAPPPHTQKGLHTAPAAAVLSTGLSMNNFGPPSLTPSLSSPCAWSVLS
jgi:hypothetical protein